MLKVDTGYTSGTSSLFNVEMLKVDTGYTSCTSSLFNVRSDCNDCSVNSEAGGCLSKVTQVPEKSPVLNDSLQKQHHNNDA